MDTGQVRRPNFYFYPLNDPQGFLDVATVLYEDDGDYAEVGKAIVGIGSQVGAIAAATGNLYVAIAGGIISVAGSITSLVSALDADDELGVCNFSYSNAAQLESMIGESQCSFLEDDANYRAKFLLFKG